MGFLYIIQNNGQTKIGITTNIQRRMKELKPDKICKVVRLPAGEERALERKLHQQFADKRLPGSEYFSLNWSQRRKACSLARRAGKVVRFADSRKDRPLTLPKSRRLPPTVALEICGVGLAVGVAAVLISQGPANRQPRNAPVSFFPAPTKSFVSV